MDLKIANMKDRFYQWDTGQHLIVEEKCREIHFSQEGAKALVCQIKEENGKRVVDVPNILLQKAETITAYVVSENEEGAETVWAKSFRVQARPRPENYVYTQTEVLNFSTLVERLEKLEGEGISLAVEAYLKENPVEAGATAEEAEQIQQNKTNIEQLTQDKLDAAKLPEAVNDALAQAKASGEFKGDPGEKGGPGPEGAAGEDGYSIFYANADYTYEESTDGSITFNIFSIEKIFILDNGRDIQVGDLIVFKDLSLGRVSGFTGSGRFVEGNIEASLKGAKGDKYELTEADKQEIAELAAEIVEVPECGATEEKEYTADLSIVGFTRTNGTFSTADCAYRTDYVSTEGVNKIRGNAGFYSDCTLIAFYDADKAFLSDISVLGSAYTTSNGSYGEGTFELDISGEEYANAAYFVVSTYRWTTVSYTQTFADDYCKYVKVEEVEETEKPDYRISQNTIAFFGDSITAGAGDGDYPSLIASITGAKVTNHGKSGATLATGTTATHHIAELVDSYTDNDDIICISGGINDMNKSVPIGELTNGYADVLDTTTVIGALESIFRNLLTNHPTAKLYYVITHKASGAELNGNSLGLTFTDYHDAIVSVLEKYSIPFYDAFSDSGFITSAYSAWGEAVCNLYTVNADGVHPNKDGYMKYYVYPVIAMMEYGMSSSGNGGSGDDYVLTEADKQEIAEQAAQLVDVPEGGSGGGTTDINIKKWFGKKIVVDGSSITTGGTGLTQPTWFTFIKDMFALNTVYNHAGSGTDWVGGYQASDAFRRVDSYEADADAIIMMGDYNNSCYTWGSFEDDADIEGSYYARLKALAEKLINKYPLCPVIWVIEPPRGNDWTPMEAADETSAIHNISKAMKEVAEYYGFPVCDCLRSTVFRPWIQANYDETTSDGTHPWNNVQRTLAQMIAETMKRTPIFYNESYVVTPDNSGGNTGEDPGTGEDTTDKVITKITVTPISGYQLFESDTLANVKQAITVKATYDDLSVETVTNYDVTGELVAGNQTFTITYEGVTTTIVLAVTAGERTVTIALADCLEKNSFILNGTGEVSVNENTGYSQMLAVKPGTDVTLTQISSGWPSMIICYDEVGNYSKQIKGIYGTTKYTLDESTYYIRVNGELSGVTPQIITYVPR